MMRWAALLLAALVVVSTLAVAAPPWAGKGGEEKSSTVTRPEVNVYSAIGQERVERMRRMGVDVNVVVQKVEERMRKRGQVNVVAVRNAEKYRKAFMKMYRASRETVEKYREMYHRWYQYRQMYEKGEINDETYFRVSKDFVVGLIGVMVQRLEALQEENLDANVDALIGILNTLREEINGVADLKELRTLYREEIYPLLQEARELFRKYYGIASVSAAESILVRLDVAVARLTTLEGSVDQNELNDLLAKIEALKAEVKALRDQYLKGEISFQDLVERLRELKSELRDLYREIADLYRELSLSFNVAVKASGEVVG